MYNVAIPLIADELQSNKKEPLLNINRRCILELAHHVFRFDPFLACTCAAAEVSLSQRFYVLL